MSHMSAEIRCSSFYDTLSAWPYKLVAFVHFDGQLKLDSWERKARGQCVDVLT
jgi:hypothetical protein